MNILFALSQIRVTGAETYVATLAKELKHRGHHVFVVSDTFSTPFEGKYFSLSLDKRTLINKIKNVFKLKKIIQEEKIDILHAHSRASSWVGYYATRLAKIPMVTTVHGIQRPHKSLKVFPCLGDYAIAICENVYEHIIKNFGFPKEKTKLIRNGIFLSNSTLLPKELSAKKIAIYISRTDGPKGKILKLILREVLPEIFKSLPDWEILIVGGDEKEIEISLLVDRLNQNFPLPKVKWLKFQKNLLEIFFQSDLVIGTGRVAMEAMAYGRPVLALGESEVYGLLNENNFPLAQKSNFGDCGKRKNYQKEELIELFKRVFSEEKETLFQAGLWCQKRVREEYDIKNISSSIENIYLELTKK
jgi:glycosyltransferase involved in cell wall biosynthesis